MLKIAGFAQRSTELQEKARAVLVSAGVEIINPEDADRKS